MLNHITKTLIHLSTPIVKALRPYLGSLKENPEAIHFFQYEPFHNGATGGRNDYVIKGKKKNYYYN